MTRPAIRLLLIIATIAGIYGLLTHRALFEVLDIDQEEDE